MRRRPVASENFPSSWAVSPAANPSSLSRWFLFYSQSYKKPNIQVAVLLPRDWQVLLSWGTGPGNPRPLVFEEGKCRWISLGLIQTESESWWRDFLKDLCQHWSHPIQSCKKGTKANRQLQRHLLLGLTRHECVLLSLFKGDPLDKTPTKEGKSWRDLTSLLVAFILDDNFFSNRVMKNVRRSTELSVGLFSLNLTAMSYDQNASISSIAGDICSHRCNNYYYKYLQ